MGKWRWGVIIDAGSSGSRLHVYRWKDPSRAIRDADADDLHSLPKIKTKWTKKIRPGVSTFGDSPTEIGSAHLQQLVDYALEVVPSDMVADTPIFLMATAGMRLLPQLQQKALLREMCSYLQQNTEFSLPNCDQNIQVISGQTEGLYGWLAANYLLGGFDNPTEHMHGQNHHTYGFLDMGGASAQIAFAPNTTESAEHSADLKFVRLRTLDGEPSDHRVFTTTWLGFGVNQARETYVETLSSTYSELLASGGDIPDPCLPKGLRTTLDGTVLAGSPKTTTKPATKTAATKPETTIGTRSASGIETARSADVEQSVTRRRFRSKRAGVPALIGTGDFSKCLVGTKPLLDKEDASCAKGVHPCLVHDTLPSIDFNVNRFVGVSEYYHSTHGFFGDEDGDHAYDFSTYQKKVQQFCNQDWSKIADKIDGGNDKDSRKKHKDPDRLIQDAQQACFKASWVINVLHEGIGIPRVGLEKLPGLNVSHEALEHAKEQGFVSPFRPVDKIDSVEVSWTLGRMLLYAAGQIPPHKGTEKGIPVGFGSNIKDVSVIPSDFTYAGSSWEPLKKGFGSGGHHDDDDDWGDAADDILEKARKKPASSGFFVFIILLVLAFFLLRKKERRNRIFNRFGILVRKFSGGAGGVGGSPRKPGRSTLSHLTQKLFGSGSHSSSRNYDRILEEGQMMDQFELGDVVDSSSDNNDNDVSDSSDGHSASSSRFARTSGLATPQLSMDKFDDLRSGSALDRSGLVVRTESRDRLAPSLQMSNAGRRSRAASPTRMKSPMMPLGED